MDILSPQLSDYLANLVPPRHPVLQQMEARAEQEKFPIIGPVCGNFCYRITRGSRAQRVFEMGSGFGYSTAWFARGVQENGGGEVHHVVWDAELSKQAQSYLDSMGFQDIVHYTVGEAIQALNAASGTFDIIFMDIDKQDYPKALPTINTKLSVGGTLIVDNMLWSGRIFDQKDESPETLAIRELTGMLMSSDQWLASIIPVRDGLLVANKVA